MRSGRSAGGASKQSKAFALDEAAPLKLECQHFVRLVQEGWDGREMHDGLEVVRALELLTESLRG